MSRRAARLEAEGEVTVVSLELELDLHRVDAILVALDGALDPVDGRMVPRGGAGGRTALLDYGTSYDQLSQIRVPELHARGLTGRGVVVAVFDAGFPTLSHEAFATMSILAERDFVNGLRPEVGERFG